MHADRFPVRFLALCAVALAAPLGAHAQVNVHVEASASLSDISWKVFDLAPGDGLAPGYTFVSAPLAPAHDGVTVVSTSTRSDLLPYNVYNIADGRTSSTLLAPLQASSTNGLSSASAESGAGFVKAQSQANRVYTPSTEPVGSAEQGNAFAGIGSSQGWGGNYSSYVTLEVAPYTAIEVTGVVTIAGSYTLDVCDGCFFGGIGYINVAAALGFGDAHGINQVTSGGGLDDTLSFDYLRGPGSRSGSIEHAGSRAIRASYANTTGETVQILFGGLARSSTYISGYAGFATPTPEPASWLLVGLGLGAAAVVGARTKREKGVPA